MGLDSYAIKSKNLDDRLFEGIGTLCGGMLSQGNDENGGTGSSFRGKVYNDFIEDITGKSLYEDMGNYDCGEISTAIEQWLKDNPRKRKWQHSSYPVTRKEIVTLGKWFKIVFDNDGSYHAWY